MGKRGSGRSKRTGRGVQAPGCSTNNENTNTQEELAKNVSEKQVRKIKEEEKSKTESPAPMSTRARTAHDKMSAETHGENPACSKLETNDLKPVLLFPYDIDERKLNVKSPQTQQGSSFDISKQESESLVVGNKFAAVRQSSKNSDDEQNLDLTPPEINRKPSSETEQEITSNVEIEKSPFVAQDPKLLEINEKMQNIDLNTSTSKQDKASENRTNLKEPKVEQHGKIINLRSDVNLHLEFDSSNIRTVLVDNKDSYIADKKQKMTFNIGEGNAQLSFIDNKVCISTKRGEIDCCIRKNQVVFSLREDNETFYSSPEKASTSELSQSKDIKLVTDYGSTNAIKNTKTPSLEQCEEILVNKDCKNVDQSNLKFNLSLMPKSVFQRQITETSETFLARVSSSCSEFQKGFLECLKKRNNESSKQ